MTHITSLAWEGDIEGVLLLRASRDDAPIEWTFDRPGDVVAVCSPPATFPSDEFAAAIAFYGVVLASRGIPDPTYVQPIVDKTSKFVGSIQPMSLVMFRELGRLKEITQGSGLDGKALREFVLAEAHAMHQRAVEGAAE